MDLFKHLLLFWGLLFYYHFEGFLIHLFKFIHFILVNFITEYFEIILVFEDLGFSFGYSGSIYLLVFFASKMSMLEIT